MIQTKNKAIKHSISFLKKHYALFTKSLSKKNKKGWFTDVLKIVKF